MACSDNVIGLKSVCVWGGSAFSIRFKQHLLSKHTSNYSLSHRQMGICLWIPNIQIRHLNLLLCVATSPQCNWPGVVQQELEWSFKECFVSTGRAAWFAWISIALQAHSRWRVQDGKDNTIHQGKSLFTRLINLSSFCKTEKQQNAWLWCRYWIL